MSLFIMALWQKRAQDDVYAKMTAVALGLLWRLAVADAKPATNAALAPVAA